jgi:hypothetical protein
MRRRMHVTWPSIIAFSFSYKEDACHLMRRRMHVMSYEEEDACHLMRRRIHVMSYEEEDACHVI